MKTSKKLFVTVLLAVSCLFLCFCGKTEDTQGNEKEDDTQTSQTLQTEKPEGTDTAVDTGTETSPPVSEDSTAQDTSSDNESSPSDAPTPTVEFIELEGDSVIDVNTLKKISGAQLTAAYKFSVDENTEVGAYKSWHADFVVITDKDIAEQSAVFAVKYASGFPLFAGKWLGAKSTDDFKAGNEIRLLKDAVNFIVTYEEVCGFRDFYCGLGDLTGENAGTKITIELRIYEATGASFSTETGKYITIETVEYVIGSPAIDTIDELNTALAQGGTVILADDIVTNEKITVPAGVEVVLDLNGNTISGAFDNNGGSALIENKGSLTITNGTVVSLAEFPDVDWGIEGYPTYATNTIVNRGTLVIGEGAYIENKTNAGGASYAIDNYAGGNVTINGGIIRAKDVAIRQFTSSTTQENNVTINGGYILGKRAVWVHIAGSDATKAPLANLTVNGGTLCSNVIDSTGNVIYSYSFGDSFANTNITITGGEFLDGQVAFGGGYKGDTENVTVTGGTFEQDVVRWLAGGSTELIFAANS